MALIREKVLLRRSSRVSKIISYKEYSSDEEDSDPCDWCLPKYHLSKGFVLKELLNSSFSNLVEDTSSNKIYFIRLWSRNANKYFYKVGETINLEQRIGTRGLNTEFDSCGKITLISCVNSSSVKNDETNIHNLLNSHRINDSRLREERKGKSRESYAISHEVFSIWKKFVNQTSTCSNVFISKNYDIDEDNNETLLFNKKTNYLDQSDLEEEFWLSFFI